VRVEKTSERDTHQTNSGVVVAVRGRTIRHRPRPQEQKEPQRQDLSMSSSEKNEQERAAQIETELIKAIVNDCRRYENENPLRRAFAWGVLQGVYRLRARRRSSRRRSAQ
jgi:hypothetical protein